MLTIVALACALNFGCEQTIAKPDTQNQVAEATTGRDGREVVTRTRSAESQDSSNQDESKGGQHRNVSERLFQLDDLQTVELKVDGHKFKCWVMDTYEKRQEGMMFLKDTDWKEDEGMIFVFMRAEPRSFWMKNTLVPLDIAYIDANQKVLNTYTMKALDTTTDYGSKGATMFVLEAKAGIFKKLGIEAGDKAEIPESVVSRDGL